MVILRTRNKITDFFMILAWASPFNILILSVRVPSLYVRICRLLTSDCDVGSKDGTRDERVIDWDQNCDFYH